MNASDDNSPVIIVAGPTASGKSALALALAERLDGVVINADSMQVYQGLRVLTARPSPADEARVPHRLYGILDPAERCSAGRWRELAVAEIAAAYAAGRRAIVTGGTGFYIEALTRGLSPIPDPPPEVLAETEALCSELGVPAFAAELARHDARAAARIGARDRQRLIRAWAVYRATGRPLSHWQALPPEPAPFPHTALWLNPPRDTLYECCNRRLEAMLAEGALQEVEALLARELDPDLPAMKALGVPDLAAYLRGTMSLEEALAAAQRATRRFAKRQLTWFRHRLPEALRIDAQFSESFLEEILSFIRKSD